MPQSTLPPATDLRQLRYFAAIVEQGSITRAAQVLGVAQPALSSHLRNMEARLGVTLLTRGRAGVTPTEAGALLARRARGILEEVARTEDDLRNLDRDPAGLVRIGLPGTIGGLVALPLIEAAKARYPRIRLNIAEAMSGFVGAWLEEGRVDVGVQYAASAARAVESELLLEEELAVILPGGADAPEEMALHALNGAPMVLPSRAHGLRVLAETACAEYGFAPEAAVEIDSYANVKRLVAAGHGASILPLHAVTEEIAAGSLRAARIAPPGLRRGVHLARSAARPATRAQEAIRDVLREVILDLVATGAWAAARRPEGG